MGGGPKYKYIFLFLLEISLSLLDTQLATERIIISPASQKQLLK